MSNDTDIVNKTQMQKTYSSDKPTKVSIFLFKKRDKKMNILPHIAIIHMEMHKRHTWWLNIQSPYLDARRKKRGQIILHIFPKDSIYLFYKSCKLLLEKQSWIFCINLLYYIECTTGKTTGWAETLRNTIVFYIWD